jgi:hypothetical protein
MRSKRGGWRAPVVLWIGLLAPGTALAGPYLGDWGWCWHQDRDCARGEYSPLHYWTPGLYKVRAYVHPSNLDQYPPGPSPSVPASFETTRYRCRSIPPTPSSPYADPTGYYGRQVLPE